MCKCIMRLIAPANTFVAHLVGLTHVPRMMNNIEETKAYMLFLMLLIASIIDTSWLKEKFEEQTIFIGSLIPSELQGNHGTFEKDAQFIRTAAELNMKQMMLDQIALKKANDREVKELGERLEAKRVYSYTQMKDLADRKLIVLPDLPAKRTQTICSKLSDKSSLDFDKSYSSMMVAVHQEAIALIQKASKQATDPEIKAWALESLPELQTGLTYAIVCQNGFDRP